MAASTRSLEAASEPSSSSSALAPMNINRGSSFSARTINAASARSARIHINSQPSARVQVDVGTLSSSSPSSLSTSSSICGTRHRVLLHPGGRLKNLEAFSSLFPRTHMRTEPYVRTHTLTELCPASFSAWMELNAEQSLLSPGVMEGEIVGSLNASPMVAPLPSSRLMQLKQESSERDNFYANMGSAVRTLREEMPVLFYKDLSYNIYRDDITFRDPRNTFTGIDNYKLIFWALRFHGRIFFKAVRVDVLRIWQPSDRAIVVRWVVRGIPRVPWEAQGSFEGTSEYKLDKNGKIYEHKVDNVALNYPPMLKTLTVLDLLSVTRGRATPTPTFFDGIPLPHSEMFTCSEISTWERFYWALTETIIMRANRQHWSWALAS